ncbi:ABC transporter ATP-binding protein [Variovorax sp. VNK109]|uniref:ABC transporter ATP-binding protein n=1 Tax=Variovorax sp. VNK109 TaxID=3400919 RepID=UPI003C0C9EE1
MSEFAVEVKGLHAYYGDSHVLHGIDLNVRPGEVVTLLGRNGAGRTTTLRAVMGLLSRCEGAVRIRGRDALGLAPHRVARLGVGYCPEERGIFASLSAEENLLLPPVVASGGMSLERIYELFPNLHERRKSPGGRLSGGEQQMLALARILRTGSRILLLDEITEGLAPVIVKALSAAIRELKKEAFTIVLVEQNFQFARRVADRHYVIERGAVALEVAAADVDRRSSEIETLLGV